MLANLERTRKLMEVRGLDAIIATHPHNVFYLSEFPTHSIYEGPPCPCLWNTPVHVVFPFEKDVEPGIILPFIQLDYYFASSSWIKDYRCYGEFYIFKAEDIDPTKLTPLERNLMEAVSTRSSHVLSIAETLVNTIIERGLSKSHLGLDERGLTPEMFEKIKQGLPNAKISRVDDLFYDIRLVKTEEEISRMRRAAQINSKCIKTVVENISYGTTEKELNELYASTVVKEGGYFVNAIIGGGTRSAVVLSPGWKPSSQPLKKGDIVRMDCYLTYRNYFSDMARVAVIGKANEKASKYHAALLTGHDEAIRTIAPGVKASEVFNVAMKKIKEGIPHYRRPHIGHSPGIECYNPLLSFSPCCDVRLEENMTMNLETPYYELGFCGMNIEDTIVVTKSGREDLASGLSRELYST